MKSLKRSFVILALLAAAAFLFSCGMASNGADKGGGFGGAAMGAPEFSGGASDIGGADIIEPEPVQRPAGLITAGAHNDNDNYPDWLALFEQKEDGTNGKFFGHTGENAWGFGTHNRIKVTVRSGDEPLGGVKVVARGGDTNSIFTAVTDANGVAYLFIDAEHGTVSAGDAVAEFSVDDRDIELSLEADDEKLNVIDLMFVVDVTGSMGDELEYLKNEVADVINRVSASNEGAKINLALLFYRDAGDKEQFAYHDFTDVTDADGLRAVQTALSGQSATGGGDYPESVDEALELAMTKQWSSGASTKLIFHILDAPPHSTSADKTRYKAAVTKAAEQGIRICPILCSGSDYLTEYLTRQAAIHTGGTFVFITDDSGIGNSHHDPEIRDVTVEALNSLMVRLINGYHTGELAEPVDWRQEVN
jgi:hypothetical protein